MAKELNKHTPDSDELLKRLNSNDSSGLDDFEKEALEGFDSLDNIEQAKQLTNELNRKIDETYFEKKEGGNKKGIMYLSMAAGLVLIVSLSVFLINYLGVDKKEMAMSPETKTSEQIANEVAKPNDIAPAEEPKKETETKTGGDINTITTTDALSETTVSGKKEGKAESDKREQNKTDKDDGLKSRMVLKEKKPERANENNKLADAEQLDESTKSQGPPAGNVAVTSPAIVVEDQKNKPGQSVGGKGKEEEAKEKNVLAKSAPDNNASRKDVVASGESSGKDSFKKSESKKQKTKSNEGEALASDDAKTKAGDETDAPKTLNQTEAGSAPTETKRDESGYVHNAEFANRSYSKPQDYIKVEIDKSEMLKTNVKAFKAELTINEKGIVTAVKFLTAFDNCTGCKKELEKVLLNMPGWKAATKGEKTVTETVSFIYP
jgi:hypothetical protein